MYTCMYIYIYIYIAAASPGSPEGTKIVTFHFFYRFIFFKKRHVSNHDSISKQNVFDTRISSTGNIYLTCYD